MDVNGRGDLLRPFASPPQAAVGSASALQSGSWLLQAGESNFVVAKLMATARRAWWNRLRPGRREELRGDGCQVPGRP
jgi:hypothetical protein